MRLSPVSLSIIVLGSAAAMPIGDSTAPALQFRDAWDLFHCSRFDIRDCKAECAAKGKGYVRCRGGGLRWGKAVCKCT